MAFGDKVNWYDAYSSRFQTPTVSEIVIEELKPPIEDALDALPYITGVPVDVVPMPELKQRKVIVDVPCCENSINIDVKPGLGTIYCLKCKRVLTLEHFNRVMDDAARRAPGLAWKFRSAYNG